MSWSGLGLAFLATLFFWGVGAYNRLMRLRNAIGEAFHLLDRHLEERGAACAKVTQALRPLVPSETASFDALDKAQAEAEAAAQAARTNLSDFIRRRAVEAAEEDMLERRQVVIAAEDWERFEAWVHEEPRQVEALGKLAASRPAWER